MDGSATGLYSSVSAVSDKLSFQEHSMSCNPEKRKSSSRFNPDWRYMFLSAEYRGDAQCLVCKKQMVCKKFNVQRHYEMHHEVDYKSYQSEERIKLISHLSEDVSTI